MNSSRITADLELNFEVSSEVTLANERHNAFSFPCGFYDVINELRNCYRAGSVWSCVVLACQLSALHGVSALDVLSVCVDVLRCISYFHCCDFPFVFNFFDDIALSLDDSSHVSFSLLDFELDLSLTLLKEVVLCFDSIHRLVCFGLFKFVLQFGLTCFDLLCIEYHDFFFRHLTSSIQINLEH